MYSKNGTQRRSREQNRARGIIKAGRSRESLWKVRKSRIRLGEQTLSRIWLVMVWNQQAEATRGQSMYITTRRYGKIRIRLR
jgi:hypothetical protein